MLHDLIQGHGCPKFVKMADFKVYLLRQYRCNQKTNNGLLHSKTISKLSRDIFDICLCLVSRDLQT